MNEMETDKFYTPTIEEFHVGFDIEVNVEGRWIPIKYMENYLLGQGKPDILDLHNNLKDSVIRVKYLDREDVELLGWYVKKEPYRWQFYKYNYMLICDIYSSIDSFPKGTIHIQDLVDNQSLFYGIIKNKSELVRIMKQIGIK